MISFPQILSQSYSFFSPNMHIFQNENKICIIQFPVLFFCLLSVLTFHFILSYPDSKSNHFQTVSPDVHSWLIKQIHPWSKKNKKIKKLFSVVAWMAERTIILYQKLSFACLLIPYFLFKMYITWFREC